MDWDNSIKWWIDGIPYLWNSDIQWNKCSRTYIIHPIYFGGIYKLLSSEECHIIKKYFQAILFDLSEYKKSSLKLRINGEDVDKIQPLSSFE